MYVAGLVIPAPEDKMEAYRKWAASSLSSRWAGADIRWPKPGSWSLNTATE